jgi:hypothetical protein
LLFGLNALKDNIEVDQHNIIVADLVHVPSEDYHVIFVLLLEDGGTMVVPRLKILAIAFKRIFAAIILF